jgi:hypothetical protein
MTRSTEDLIAALAADLQPIRRLKPPMARAGLWLAVVGAASILAILIFADIPGFLARAADARMAIELLATLLTGIAAVVAAFHLSLPDRSRAWALMPLPPLAGWLAVSGLGCYRAWIVDGPFGPEPGRSVDCLLFILAGGLPMGAFMIWALAKARPLYSTSTAAVGGLGVAALSAFVLQFFHPFEMTLVDLVVHAAAVLLVVTVATESGRRAFEV